MNVEISGYLSGIRSFYGLISRQACIVFICNDPEGIASDDMPRDGCFIGGSTLISLVASSMHTVASKRNVKRCPGRQISVVGGDLQATSGGNYACTCVEKSANTRESFFAALCPVQSIGSATLGLQRSTTTSVAIDIVVGLLGTSSMHHHHHQRQI